jgi:imidazole glycerol-phosphate synthase subunit HisF
MLYPRIIPSLLVHNKGLVKTRQFKDPKYVGDPINAVRIFNEKSVDELAVFDIGATNERREPDYRMIEHLAAECRMPFCYGGGIKTVEQARRIFGLGVEKVAISSAALDDPGLVTRMADCVGRQSVVVVLDVKKNASGRYSVHTHGAQRDTGKGPVECAQAMEKLGAGEIVVNSIDNDGVMKGYDFALIDTLRGSVSLPMTFLGGAGSLKDIGELISRHGIIGAAAGSLFVFKGIYRAVLINYPSRADKESLIKSNWDRFVAAQQGA